jgi:hypothetical protein
MEREQVVVTAEPATVLKGAFFNNPWPGWRLLNLG